MPESYFCACVWNHEGARGTLKRVEKTGREDNRIPETWKQRGLSWGRRRTVGKGV